jgi:predicted metal-dependent hydrolase
MNHSSRFWAEVERVMPDYRRHRQWLKEEGGSIMQRI